jgi:hypothetical protein
MSGHTYRRKISRTAEKTGEGLVVMQPSLMEMEWMMMMMMMMMMTTNYETKKS